MSAATTPAAGAAAAVGDHRRHRPETTALYEVVRDNLETLYGAIDDGALAVRIPKHARKELEAYLDCGLLCRGYVVTQSVLSLRHAHAVAGKDHATTPPTARTRSRGAAHWLSRVGRACARRILDEAAESVDGCRRRGRGGERARCGLQRGCDPGSAGDRGGPAAAEGH